MTPPVSLADDPRAMMRAHLDALWPVAWRDTLGIRQGEYFLVRSHPDPVKHKPNGDPAWVSAWHRVRSDMETCITESLAHSTAWNEYYGVNLGRADASPAPTRRLTRHGVMVVSGLLSDWDGGWGAHKSAEHLPETLEALLAFLHALPCPPSLIVDTGGGVHTYHLFPEPWVLATPEDRAAFLDLATRFNDTVTALAHTRHGWDISSLYPADLSRVLRLPGTINHKYGTVVTTLEATDQRYRPDTLRAWLPPRRTPTRVAQTSSTPATPGTLDLLTLAEHYGVELSKKSDTEWYGSHPVHGSDTGTNLSLNDTTHLWHCFRHDSGGDALMFLAMCEGLLDCDDAKPGEFRGMAYVNAVDLANAAWQAGIVLDERQARLEAQTAADDALAHELQTRPAQSLFTPPDDGDPDAHTGALAHRLPDHLRHHPDPRVRQHWQRLYRKANALKQARAKEGLLL